MCLISINLLEHNMIDQKHGENDATKQLRIAYGVDWC